MVGHGERACPYCKGRGTVELTGEYAVTLEFMRKVGGEIWAAELARNMGIAPTAMCNRLAALEADGFVTSRRFGRRRLFKVAADKRD